MSPNCDYWYGLAISWWDELRGGLLEVHAAGRPGNAKFLRS